MRNTWMYWSQYRTIGLRDKTILTWTIFEHMTILEHMTI